MNYESSSGPPADAALRRSTATALLLVCCALAPPLAAEDDASPRVSGRVLGAEVPISSAEVYAYDVATYALEKVTTDQKGRFLFAALPAGLYKIIAHKDGFVPAVELLLRRSPDARQFLEMRLVEQRAGDVRTAEGYWETRARIPADVLQQIRQVGLSQHTPDAGLLIAGAERFETRVAADGGVAQVGDGRGAALLTDAEVGVRGPLGDLQMEFDGRYRELAPTGEDAAVPTSEVHSMSLSLAGVGDGRLSLDAAAGDLAEVRDDGVVPVDLSHYRVSWSGQAGGGTSEVSAQLIDESNFYNAGIHNAGIAGALELAESSRTLNLQGSFSRDVTSSTSLETGVSYRQREGYRLLDPDGSLAGDERVGVYGVAESQVQQRVLVEYGLYSTMREGELSLMPHGGMVVRLGSDWKARTSFSQRVDEAPNDDPQAFDRFSTAFYSDPAACREIGDACYEVTFERGEEGEESLSVGAIHREFAETLRLYFSDDFFNRLESLLLVPGDQLPELKFSMVRRISPKVLAKLESNFASGGGGIFYATDDQAYENQVRYLVTSLDTRFQGTSTGVFLAFHHLEQALNPVATEDSAPSVPSELVEVQRLQLMLTQDLSALANIAPSLAVRFNMELSRGTTPYTLTNDDELHKKLTGGISVSF